LLLHSLKQTWEKVILNGLKKRMNYEQPLIKYLNYFTTNRKLITPEEVAEFASFLVSDNASGITGQVFTLESGFNLQWYEALK